MTKQSPLRTDLVIAMTLAETFLLLLFVVWYSVVRAAGDKPPDIWMKLAEERQQKIQQLQNQLAERDKRIAELDALLNWWHTEFNADPPQSRKDLVKILQSPQGKAVLADVGRGYPRCEDQNTLVHASIVRGAVTMELLSDSPQLTDWSAASGVAIPAPHAVLSGWNSIRSFLSTVDGFYESRPTGSGCRFDYRLTYETKEDYYDGREAFEHGFYPAGMSRVPQQ